MFFASDNSGPVHPQVIAALTEANTGYAMAYGADPQMDEVRSRLREIFEGLSAVIREHRPDEVAIEKIFMNRNADSAIRLGQARGAAIVAAARARARVGTAPPRPHR